MALHRVAPASIAVSPLLFMGNQPTNGEFLPNVYSLPCDVFIYTKALIIFWESKCLSWCLDFCELSAMTACSGFMEQKLWHKKLEDFESFGRAFGRSKFENSPPRNSTWTPPRITQFWKQYGCFRKSGYPQIIHFNRVFHYKPSILGVFPLFLEPPIYYRLLLFAIFCWFPGTSSRGWYFAFQAPRHGSRPAALEAIIATWHEDLLIQDSYCWWKKSCTTWDT